MAIPKKIHYCWFGGASIPEKDQKCIDSWSKFCPDYEIIRWDESNYDLGKNVYMREAYEAKKWGFVPDYARLDIVNTEGGIYLDTDVEIIKPFDDLLAMGLFCGFESKDKVAFGLGFGAEPGHPFLRRLLASYEDIHFVNEDGSLNMLPSPEIQTPVLVDDGLALDGSYQILTDDVHVLPIDWLCPQSFLTGKITITPNTHSIHHYAMSWASESRKLQRDYAVKLCDRGIPEKTADSIAKIAAVIKTGDFGRITGKMKKR